MKGTTFALALFMRLAPCVIALTTLATLTLASGCGGGVAPIDDGKGTPATKGSTPTAPPTTATATATPTTPSTPPSNPSSPSAPPSVVIPPVRASSYDATCTTTDDCIAITETNSCGCDCPNAAINKRDLERESADQEAHWNACVASHAPACGANCAARPVFCDIGNDAPSGVCRMER